MAQALGLFISTLELKVRDMLYENDDYYYYYNYSSSSSRSSGIIVMFMIIVIDRITLLGPERGHAARLVVGGALLLRRGPRREA